MWKYGGNPVEFQRERKRGHVCTNDTGLIVERDPDTVRGADVTLYDEVRRYDELNVKYSDRAEAAGGGPVPER